MSDHETTDQAPIGILYNSTGAKSVKLVMVLNTDPASENVRVTVDGRLVATVTSGTAIGVGPVGHPAFAGLPACYVATADISGLKTFGNANPYIVSQASSSVSGNFVTRPGVNQDFKTYVFTCNDQLSSLHGNYNASRTPQEPHASGMWKNIRDYAAENNDVAMVFGIDDVIYADLAYVDDSAGTGHITSDAASDGPAWTAEAYDYTIGWMNFLGMMEDTTTFEVSWGRNSNRIWCQRNLPMCFQYGDHEFANDFGLASDQTVGSAVIGGSRTVNGTGPQTGPAIWAAAKEPWDAICGPLIVQSLQDYSGPATGDPNANHWGDVVGCVRFVSPDAYYNSTPDGASGNCVTPITHILDSGTVGESQIADLLAYLNDSIEPFNIVLWPLQFRRLYASTGKESAGCSWSYKDVNAVEFSAFVTANSGTFDSIMHSSKTNGVEGHCAFLCGDFHNMAAMRYYAGGGAGDEAEQISVFYLGTMTGSTNFGMDGFVLGSQVGMDVDIDYRASAWGNLASQRGQFGYGCARIEISGSELPKKMKIILMNGKGSDGFDYEEYVREYVAYRTDNDGQAEDAVQYTQSYPLDVSADI